MAIKYQDILKRYILVSNPTSYANAFIGAMSIYALHADKPSEFRRDLSDSRKQFKAYKKLVNTYVNMYRNDKEAAAEFWKSNIHNNTIHQLMDRGIINTLRADIYKALDSNGLDSMGAIGNAVGPGYAKAVRAITLDESTYHGKVFAQAYDAMEIYPKIALALNLKRNGASIAKAAQITTMAHPSYLNLPYGPNLLDMVVPYQKFFYSTPRMAMYGFDQHPKRFVAGMAAARSIVPMSYAASSPEEQEKLQWAKDFGIAKIPGIDYGLSINSMFPTFIYGESPGNSLMESPFILDATGHWFTVPGTSLD